MKTYEGNIRKASDLVTFSLGIRNCDGQKRNRDKKKRKEQRQHNNRCWYLFNKSIFELKCTYRTIWMQLQSVLPKRKNETAITVGMFLSFHRPVYCEEFAERSIILNTLTMIVYSFVAVTKYN